MKTLKSTRASPDEMLRIAGAVAPTQPSAVAQNRDDEKDSMLSVRLTEGTLESLATYARVQGATQRRIIAEALSAYGVRVAARDLEDRPPPRRRGSSI
jgi:hypothetical protein